MLSRLLFGYCLLCVTALPCLGQGAETTIEFLFDSYFEFEDEGPAEVEVWRTGNLDSEVSVDFSAVEEIAIAGVDFEPISGTLTFAPGEDIVTFSVDYIDDSEPEGSEPILLTLSNPTGGAVLGGLTEVRLFVQDNERRGTLLDDTFDGAIGFTDFVNALVLLPDERVLAAGEFARPGNPITDRVALFDIDGSRDRDFDMEDEVPNASVYTLALQEDGKVIIGGVFTQIGNEEFNGLARLDRFGLIDGSFQVGAGVGGAAPAVYEVVIQPDGKVILAGAFESYDGATSVALARLNANGSLDSQFNLGSGISSDDPTFNGPWVSRVRLQPDGKILISGQFTEIDGVAHRNVARLNADGSVDASFSAGLGATGPAASVEALAVQPDGKILIGGDFDSVDGNPINAIARLNADGTLDTSFDPGRGVEGEDRSTGASVPGLVTDIQVLEDGKILVSGNFETIDEFGRRGIGKLLPNGRLDGTFGPYFGTTYRDAEGYQEYETVTAVAVQSDGKIITGGVYEFDGGINPVRLNRLLSRNETANSVEFDLPVISVAESSETVEVPVVRRGESSQPFTVDYFVIGGSATAGEDYVLSGGTLSFEALETQKFIEIEVIDDTDPEENEVIELGIRNASNGVGFGAPAISRVEIIDRTRPGNVDLNFGQVFIPFAANPVSFRPVTDLEIQDDGRILVAGYYTFINFDDRAGLARFEWDGSLDDSYNPTVGPDEFILEFVQMGLQPDGNLVGGLRNVRQLTPAGVSNPEFNTGVSFATTLSVAADGKVVISDNFLDPATGDELNEVVRFSPDGTIDSSFVPAALNDWGMTSLTTADGKVVVGGWFTQVNGVEHNHVVRLNENGARDITFDIGTGVEGVSPPVVLALAEQADGKLLVAGEFGLFDGIPRSHLVRLNVDGSVDESFDTGVGPNAWVEALAVQDDGRILIGGAFSRVDGILSDGIARLNSDGSVDQSFAADLTFPEVQLVTAIAIQDDGQIVIGGTFTEVNGLSRVGLARINGDDAGSIVPPEPPVVVVTEAPSVNVRLNGDNTGVVIGFDAVLGAEYSIQGTESLTAPVTWTTLTSIVADSESVSFDAPAFSEAPLRFYRVIAAGE